MRKICVLIILLIPQLTAYCQSTDTSTFKLRVLDENLVPLPGSTVQLLQNTKQVKAAVSDVKGIASFQNIPAGDYLFQVSSTGYQKRSTHSYHFPGVASDTIHLKVTTNALQEVSITARKSYIQQKQGKTIINVDASPTNTGSTVLEVLEKSPGVNVDKDGNVSLKGKSNVLVMINDKPTYLSPGDLNNLLSSMSSAQVDQIELMPNPPAKYDASGNAGIINIKTKKNKQKGFNGSFTSSVGHGIHPKNGENLTLNYRSGKINTFLNYNLNYVKYFTDLYALRKYYDANSGQLTSILNQPSDFTGTFINNTIKTGVDYSVSPKTTIGMILGATAIHRAGNNYATASWQEPSGATDSTIATTNKNITSYKNASLNLNAKHTISDKQDISADFDLLRYQINTSEDFVNQFLAPGGYIEQSRGAIPTNIHISSGKVDYTLKVGNNGTLQAGAKASHSATDNLASYQNLENGAWVDDNTKNNHFLYSENIRAVYSSFESKYGKVNVQGGVRYENTGYDADQKGNSIQKDSAFSRKYGSLFPSANITYQADSSNAFTVTAGRRIDRPVYQTLNPFYFIINKYTYQTGNPFLLPQYSWNFELTHQYKELLTTTVSYSVINNYFSQLFLADTTKGILFYSQGNVGHTNVIGLSSALSYSPFNWWQFNLQATYNHKQLVGFNGNNYTSQIDQLSLNSSSQFTIGKIYTAEISGFYITKAKQDIQEVQYPTGQLALGISRQILNKKATLKLTARDVLYTGAFSGFTNFPNATEYFKITRDTRVVTLAFTYRFGKSFKTVNRSQGSAADEAGRVGNG